MQLISKIDFNLKTYLSWALVAILSFNSTPSVAFDASPNAKFSLLTCTPGPDLYSLFGHSAIRFQDSIKGKWVDWVYNYGTFEFDDDFYVKFARGKLDYLLSKDDFHSFQIEYLYTGRGIYEQELLLSSEQKQRLLKLLEENFLPENRTYRYDFFYDNCSTRIRDIVIRATAVEDAEKLGFINPDPKKLAKISRINFSYVYPGAFTFRDAIQNYLDYQPWSDFGIDLALGMPCDKKVGKGEYMFLPDSLMHEFNYGILDDAALVSPTDELIPVDFELSEDQGITPLTVMSIFLVIHLIFGFLMVRYKKLFQLTDRFLLFITGFLGLFIVFLWFFTDHTATKWNLNIIWANPMNLFFAFISSKKWLGWRRKYLFIYLVLLVSTLLFWFVIPQRLHLATLPLILALLFTLIKNLYPVIFLGLKKDHV